MQENEVVAADLDAVRWFVRKAGTDASMSVEALLAEASVRLGFRYFALVQHGSLARGGPPKLCASNYPEDWQRLFIEHELHRIDPVQHACRFVQLGFCWSALDDFVHLTAAQRALLDASRARGIGDGFTVPVHLPGERAASCSFAVEPSAPFPSSQLWAAQLLGQFAFEAARPLGRRRRCGARLSPRQREAVRLMAAGRTDRSIARQLGLSEETVTKYVNAARRRYGLARRTQLVAAALYDGEIGFDEVLPF